MRPTLQQGVWTLSRARFVPRIHRQVRCVQVRATQPEPSVDGAHLPLANTSNSAESRDARFNVVGAPSSLLSVSLSASQNLYTRRGTLVGLSGNPYNVVSRLSMLAPLGRFFLGVPFLYQKISSITPVTALVSVRSPTTSFALVDVNGSVDWMVAQRRALLAWTGRSLSIKPTIPRSLTVAHWGSTEVTGRGLMALVGNGHVYSMELKDGEQYIVHPSNVLAYTMSSNPPRPFRFRPVGRLGIYENVEVPKFLQRNKFYQDMTNSAIWKTMMKTFDKLRTWYNRTILGDRLFLEFEGPATILVQSRRSSLRDVLSAREVNELAYAHRKPEREHILDRSVGVSEAKDIEDIEELLQDMETDVIVLSRSVENLTQKMKESRQRDDRVELKK